MSVWFKRVIPSFGGLGFGAVVAAAAVLSVATVAQADKGKEHKKFQDQPAFLGVSGSSIEFLNINGSLYCYAGTMGALVEIGGVQYILSNNHVLARQNDASLGEDMIQPGLLDENGDDKSCSAAGTDYTPYVVGALSAFETLDFAPASVNYVDAAIASVDTGMIDPDGRILDIGGLQSTTPFDDLGIGLSDTPDDLVNTSVQKSGRTTGLTTGTIGAVGAEITVNYDNGSALFQDQILITGNKGAFIKSGDSGSLMVTDPTDGTMPQAVGLLFAGSVNGLAIANRIDLVLDAFGVTIVGCNHTFDGTTGVDCAATSPAGSSDGGGGGGNGNGGGGGGNGNGGGNNGGGGGPPFNLFGLDVAAQARDAHRDNLMAHPDVVGTGLSFDENGEPVIQVYTLGARRSADHAIPNELDGVKVRVIVTGEFRAY